MTHPRPEKAAKERDVQNAGREMENAPHPSLPHPYLCSLTAPEIRPIASGNLLRDPAPLNLRQSPAGLDGLPLLLHRGFFIGTPQLELLEETALGKLVLQNLQGFFHIVVEHFDFQILSPFLTVFMMDMISFSAILPDRLHRTFPLRHRPDCMERRRGGKDRHVKNRRKKRAVRRLADGCVP